MAVEWTWAQAGQSGGTGFGLVFLVLIILALAIWLVGLVTSKTSGEASDKKKGE
jgi:Na+-transporting methylmalonyl-CoA/oxaloacetate decarboxylase gamma subunit